MKFKIQTNNVQRHDTGDIYKYETVRLQYWNVELVEWNTGMKEGNVLFNDALNTFLKRLYSIRHMVKDHSYSERGNPLPVLYEHHRTDRIAHTLAFGTPVLKQWLELK